MKFTAKKILVAAMAAAMSILPMNANAQENYKFNVEDYNQKVETPKYLVGGIASQALNMILPVSVEARFFAPHYNMSVQSDDIRYNGGKVDLENDLGFDSDNAPEFIFRYRRMTLDYIHVGGDGERNLTSPLTFDGSVFNAKVNTKSSVDYLKLQITNPIVSILGNGVDWSYGLTGMFWKGTVRGTDSTGNYVSRSERYSVPVPTLGVGGHLQPLPSLKIYASISGLPLGGYGHFYDFEAGIRYTPIDIFAITAGFRRIEADIHHNDDSGKLKMNGPFVGIRADF